VTRSAQRDQDGKFLYSINILQDISARKAAEEKLQRYQLLANSTRDIMLFMHLDDGRRIEANAAAQNYYGYSRDELLGMTIYDIRDDPELKITRDQMEEAYDRGILFETRHRRKDGSVFPVEVSSRGALIDGVRTLISVARDITERKRAEEALRKSGEEARARAEELHQLAQELGRSNQDLERFAYVVSHDLQEPVRQIVGFAELLTRRYAQSVDSDGRDYLDPGRFYAPWAFAHRSCLWVRRGRSDFGTWCPSLDLA
jgi:PAS domain S-box-containing protein